MPIHNADISAAFTEIADLLEIQGENPFRVRAYRNASRSVVELGRSGQTMIAQGENMKGIPSIGDDLAAKMREIARRPRRLALHADSIQRPAGGSHFCQKHASHQVRTTAVQNRS
jgi:DNA polymerase (family 10)